jgi:hypothetical protein
LVEGKVELADFDERISARIDEDSRRTIKEDDVAGATARRRPRASGGEDNEFERRIAGRLPGLSKRRKSEDAKDTDGAGEPTRTATPCRALVRACSRYWAHPKPISELLKILDRNKFKAERSGIFARGVLTAAELFLVKGSQQLRVERAAVTEHGKEDAERKPRECARAAAALSRFFVRFPN